MEGPGEESLDGSSIKPVSDLRSKFEQMGKPTPSNNTAPRAISPKPHGFISVGNGDVMKNVPGKQDVAKSSDDFRQATRGRERELGTLGGLQPIRTSNDANGSPSPNRGFRSKPTVAIPPAVTIQPPQSPPKGKSLNLTVSNTPMLLTAETPTSATSGTSSPRHFRIPSRPHTPQDPGNSPALSASQPPSPPPPRRSGEIRRDISFNPLPPPVNRADKPKIATKPASLGLRSGNSALEPSPTRTSMDKSSPFSTPPSSDSSPEHEIAAILPPRPKQWTTSEAGPAIIKAQRSYEPPPVHHAIVSKRKDQEFNTLGRGLISPQGTGEQRPALPSRPQIISETTKPRTLPPPVSMMPPPPPRPSMDRKRPTLNAVNTLETIPAGTTPVRRVTSTPIGQSQTPPRTHGRSMTVDRTSDRTPVEFRTPLIAPVTRNEPAVPAGSPAIGEYPDVSRSNRRPPVHKQGIREMNCRKEDAPRIMDVCGEFICTSGRVIRVWSLRSGEPIMTLNHEPETKALSIAFKPTANVEDEGTMLWMGNNVGDLIEIDVIEQKKTAARNAHTRRDVIKIHRYYNQMWTIDDSGMLLVWGPDSTGCPSLSKEPAGFRLPKGHTFSMIVDDKLWHAAGKDIRVYVPTPDNSADFSLFARPICQENAGEITSGATINSQKDRVYFGHTDGKVSIYSRKYELIRIVNISVYKITSLAGVAGQLWAGFSTGMVCVYDTATTPWVLNKDWHAHQDPVVKLIVDRSSFWSLDRSQVISLGQDNMLKVWDGLLQDDWIDNQMQSQVAEYCDFSTVNALVMTWNAGAATPYDLKWDDNDNFFFRDMLRGSDRPDIIIFGFQELVDLEDKTRTAKSFFKSKKKDPRTEQEHMSHRYRDWRDFLTGCLDDYMPGNELYHLLHTASLVGLFTCVFIRAPLRERIRSVSAAEVKRGMGGLHGNKGALVLRFMLDDSSTCLINCHLAAGQTSTKDRNADITAVLDTVLFAGEREPGRRLDNFVGGGDGTMILDHEVCILNGDMNYRIDTMGRDTVVNAVKAKNLGKLLERDQLLASKRKNPWFKLRAFHELPITFDPTYKYDVKTDRYDTSEKKRSPAWCDRILYRGDRVKQVDYERLELRVSDHRPVVGQFQIQVKKVDQEQRAVKWEECRNQLLDMRDRHGNEMMLDYLTKVIGYDAGTSKNLILQKQKNR